MDPAQLNRSLATIRTELEFLASTGILRQEQLQSIGAQLPVCTSFAFSFPYISPFLILSHGYRDQGHVQKNMTMKTALQDSGAKKRDESANVCIKAK